MRKKALHNNVKTDRIFLAGLVGEGVNFNYPNGEFKKYLFGKTNGSG